MGCMKGRYLVNPDHASKRIHDLTRSDGRCKIKEIVNPIPYDRLEDIDRIKYPNDCKICM